MGKLTWSQAMCDRCWHDRTDGRRVPHRLIDPDVEVCAWCGELTMSGIYVRANPETVPYPSEEED